jgi:ABC-type glycerol-3-phosphate transport system substrate-binding protein
MKLTKRILAGACALTLCFGMAACGSSSSDDSSTVNTKKLSDEDQAKVDDLADQLPDVELENKTIKWLAHYDINPAEGQTEDPAISLFESKYGGTIEPIITDWNNRYTELAKLVMANTAPDFFPADDMDAYPKGAIKAMFQPIDDYIDLDSDLWASSKTTCDAFYFNGGHYVAAIESQPGLVMIYNQTTIEENALDDPWELYQNDEWTWSNFTDMCLSFTNQEEDKVALDGYWYVKALNDSCGVPLVTLEDGKLVNNMENALVCKVQELMYNLQKNEVVFDRSKNNWNTRGNGETGNGLGSYQTLFIPCGLWAIENTKEDTKLFGDVEAGEIRFVPLPRLDDSDTYYVSARVHGYFLCKNAPNPEGFAAFMNCCEITNNQVSEITKNTLVNDYGWDDTMMEMREECYNIVNDHPIYDFQGGISPEVDSLMLSINQATMQTGGDAITWTECVSSNEKSLDYLLNEANTNISDTPTDD